jgi:hypothetical protein
MVTIIGKVILRPSSLSLPRKRDGFEMIEKQEFYHGVAVLRAIQDSRHSSIVAYDLGYVVNEQCLFIVKYTTKTSSPWRFTFSADEFGRISGHLNSFSKIAVGLVCGDDGICGLDWSEAEQLLGMQPGWISVKRNFSGSYAVAGSGGSMKRRVPLKRWPSLLFESEEINELDEAVAAEGDNN